MSYQRSARSAAIIGRCGTVSYMDHTLSVRLERSIIERIDACARTRGVRRSTMVRAALLRALAELELLGPVGPIESRLRARAEPDQEPCSRTLPLFSPAIGEASVDPRDGSGT